MNGEDEKPITFVEKVEGMTITFVFKPGWRPGKLMEEEKQLLLAYRSEILAEIAAEEKRIIAEERQAQRKGRIKAKPGKRKISE